jgi:hypothetical protein
MPEDLNTHLGTFLCGTKRTIAELKQKGILKPFEGKQPLSICGYNLLCKKIMAIVPEGKKGHGISAYLVCATLYVSFRKK